MSKIEKLEKDLYGETKNEDLSKRMDHREYFQGTIKKPPVRWDKDAKAPEEDQLPLTSRRVIIKVFVAVFAVILIALGSLAFFLYLGSGGNETKITIFARTPIESGEVMTIPITVKNVSKVIIREVEASVVLPEMSLLAEGDTEREVSSRYTKKLDDLTPGEERTFSIKVRMFGHEGEGKKIDVVLLYRPENLSARFTSKESQVIIIGRVPLAVAWDFPSLLSSGQEVLIRLRYTSSAKTPFKNLSLRLTYPPGFIFVSANPEPEVGNDLWKLGELGPSEEGSILIRGSVAGEEGEVKAFHAELGVYNDLTKEWIPYSDSVAEANIAVSPLSVQGFYDQSRDKIITPGEALAFTVRYKNNTEYTIKNVSVRTFLEEMPVTPKDRLLDLPSLEIDKGGVFDSVTRSIVWGPGSVSELREVKPGGEGVFSFRIKTKERPIMRTSADTNISIRLRSQTEAAGVPEELLGTRLSAEDTVSFKVKTRVLFTGRAVYRASPILNSGPLPPEVDQKTTYTIVWEIKNFTNALENVEIKTTLPPNVKWENLVSPKGERIFFDPASQEVYWRTGQLKSGIGILTPTLVGAFQVSVVPSDADRGETMVLAGESKFVGKDVFTDQMMEEKLPRFTTELRDDTGTLQGEWRVKR